MQPHAFLQTRPLGVGGVVVFFYLDRSSGYEEYSTPE